ncbi:hypothetical protein Y032_0638g964 [Ancylostoma ceylanicum]|uniref:Uncharacterized protein n=1 Tax=Ancylostoma ceylanicum TaxID=53326 RepID=A0A016WLC6_9BILA|nr:hypothetical protein Y032_0638g964 [Ancylostoma ceylanicum]
MRRRVNSYMCKATASKFKPFLGRNIKKKEETTANLSPQVTRHTAPAEVTRIQPIVGFPTEKKYKQHPVESQRSKRFDDLLKGRDGLAPLLHFLLNV